MNPFSKSVWIVPAACGANQLCWIVHARTSSAPTVKKLIKFKVWYPILMICDVQACACGMRRLACGTSQEVISRTI